MSGFLQNARVAFTGKLGLVTHAQALRIVQEAGGTVVSHVSRLTNYVVVGIHGWPLLPDGRVSQALQRAEELNTQGAGIQILSEAAFLGLVRQVEPSPKPHKSYPPKEVCRILNLPAGTLTRWEQFGLIQAENGLYDFQDLVSLQTIAELVSRGVKPEIIAGSLQGLGRVLPGTHRPLAQLKIISEHPKSVLADFGEYRLTPGGQLCFSFDRGDSASGPVLLPRQELDPNYWMQLGERYQEDEHYLQAEEAFREAVRLDPTSAVACYGLAGLLRGLGRKAEAETMYQATLQLQPDLAGAWYQLGDLQDEDGRVAEAVASLEQAIQCCPKYADAHFTLALCLEKQGRIAEAGAHWRAYLVLEPEGQWADLARSHLTETY